jgi:hypothetical protein
MTDQVTLTLPSALLEKAEILARRAGRPVGELLAETIELSLQPLGDAARDDRLRMPGRTRKRWRPRTS